MHTSTLLNSPLKQFTDGCPPSLSPRYANPPSRNRALLYKSRGENPFRQALISACFVEHKRGPPAGCTLFQLTPLNTAVLPPHLCYHLSNKIKRKTRKSCACTLHRDRSSLGVLPPSKAGRLTKRQDRLSLPPWPMLPLLPLLLFLLLLLLPAAAKSARYQGDSFPSGLYWLS